MVMRIVGVAVVAFASLLGGCSTDSGPVSSPTPTATVTTDEVHIREVLARVADASWDAAKTAELTCAKYREGRNTSPEGLVPPMEVLRPEPPIDANRFAQTLAEQFTGASTEATRAVADAVIANDQQAYRAAMTEVVKQSTKVRLDKADNIVVDGDTATADVSLTLTIGNRSQTATRNVTLVREDGKWKDCTPPEAS